MTPPAAENRVAQVREAVRQSPIFAPLSDPVLDATLKSGRLQSVSSGQSLSADSKLLGFINVIVTGRLLIERDDDSLFGKERESCSGQAFGSIESLLGIGRMVSVRVIEDSVLFQVPREEATRLVKEWPEFRNHLSHLRELIAAKLVRRTESSDAVESGSREPPLRSAARFPVRKITTAARLSDGTTRTIRDLSADGLFLEGEAPVRAAEEFSFRLESVPVTPDAAFRAKVIRISPDGFAAELVGTSPAAQAVWEDLLTRIASHEACDSFQAAFVTLPNPLPVQVCRGETSHPCRLAALNIEGGILQSDLPLPGGDFVVYLSLKLDGNAQIAAKLSAVTAGEVGSGTKILWADLSPDEERWIKEFLRGLTSSSPAVDRPSVDEKVSYNEVIRAESLAKLSKLFLEELRENQLILDCPLRYTVGRELTIGLEMPIGSPVGEDGSRILPFRGKVARIREGLTFVELDPVCLRSIAEVRKRVEVSSHQRFRKDFFRHVEEEHNRVNRRPIQFVLVLMLLGACVFWVMRNIDF